MKQAIAASSSLQARWHSPRFRRKAALVGSSAIAASNSAAASAGLPRRSSSRPLGRVGGNYDSHVMEWLKCAPLLTRQGGVPRIVRESAAAQLDGAREVGERLVCPPKPLQQRA